MTPSRRGTSTEIRLPAIRDPVMLANITSEIVIVDGDEEYEYDPALLD